jgi:hypothetical protein
MVLGCLLADLTACSRVRDSASSADSGTFSSPLFSILLFHRRWAGKDARVARFKRTELVVFDVIDLDCEKTVAGLAVKKRRAAGRRAENLFAYDELEELVTRSCR